MSKCKEEVSQFIDDFIGKLEQTNIKNTDIFQTIIKESQTLLGWTDDSLADFFGVSLQTVKRWKNGINTPYAIARQAIYEQLRLEIEKKPKDYK